MAERLLSEGGVLDTLTARNGPLDQLTLVADTLNRITPGWRRLVRRSRCCTSLVETLSSMVNPISNFADRFPLRPRSRRSRFSPQATASAAVVDAEDRRSLNR